MEICKMLTLSTAHITKETADKVNHDCKPVAMEDYDLHPFLWDLNIVGYLKDEYGWFLWISPADLEVAPEDLRQCIKLALDNDCEWLCLDRDGPIEESLPIYEWED